MIAMAVDRHQQKLIVGELYLYKKMMY